MGRGAFEVKAPPVVRCHGRAGWAVEAKAPIEQ